MMLDKMISYKDLDPHKEAFVFELDDVLFPERDYLLQVYYLFAHLLEYTETVPPANDLVDFFRKCYTHHGATGIFLRAAETFGIDLKYEAQFKQLHVQAKLPLPLLLFDELEALLKAIVSDKKQVLILTRGNPLMQLNKIKQINWGELAQAVKIYFFDELIIQGHEQPLQHILCENNIPLTKALFLGKDNILGNQELVNEVDYLPVQRLFR